MHIQFKQDNEVFISNEIAYVFICIKMDLLLIQRKHGDISFTTLSDKIKLHEDKFCGMDASIIFIPKGTSLYAIST